jgi:hypothetical protein
MDYTDPNNTSQLISLETAAQILDVSVDTLIRWNDYNILKPTITHAGQVGYKDEQINQFLAIRQRSQNSPLAQSNRSFLVTPIFAFIFSFSTTVVSLTAILKLLPNQANTTETVLAPPISQISLTEPIIPPSDNPGFFTYAQTSNFAFDNQTPNTDVLAAAFPRGTTQSSSPIQQIVDPNILLVFFALGLLIIPFIYKRQSPKPLSDQKILEVNQKADGTVVLCFQGQEYKVSKPELDSESDQFIERLMELVGPDVKEIDYDTSADEGISLSAPLSKLVTRLGFVGLKRDLFFPRTSKNRVLFRRYLTSKDLASMDLHPGQISQAI